MRRLLEMATRWGVAREIGEHGLGSGERGLGIDDPFGLAQGCQVVCEGTTLDQPGMIAEEQEAAGLVGGRELLQDHASEQPREDAHGQEEAGPAG